ncbi:dnaJ homolog subfamily C member 9-like [Tyto alba]|uniref:dnaJ homolog subfamily C member 9-like n=1 Tax=Tyto alba TaxID=56313 RepID=UPI001C67BB07|nr:dnaJ homolog subfamily C member 9-like [Tyto alba]
MRRSSCGCPRASLRVHPGRAEPHAKEEATRRFQILGKAYAALSEAEQRALYGEQGTVEEEGEVLRGERDWQEYWRLVFKKAEKEAREAEETKAELGLGGEDDLKALIQAEKEAREAEETKAELGLGGEDDLKALIQSRSKDRKREMDDFLAQLESKYRKNAKKGEKTTAAKKGKK